jgi:lactoylglutathione lyase
MAAIIKKLDHVGLVTKDLKASIKFYTEAFGFKLVSEETLPLGMDNAILDASGETFLELVQFTDGRDYNYADGYFEFLSLHVSSIEEAVESIKANGGEIIMPEPVEIAPGEYFTFFRAPGGEKVEIVQRP